MIAGGSLPHLLFAGVSGTGKTSLAELILTLMGVPDGDILVIPASRERKVEEIQDRIEAFANVWALGPTGIKYIILDEADSLSPLAQRVLRNEMDGNDASTRFILTCNYQDRIIPAIQGRCQTHVFKTLDRDDFTARLGEILMREEVSFEIDALLATVEAAYPDMRKAINLAQQNTLEGVLSPPRSDDGAAKDYLIEMAALFRAGRTQEARKLIVSQAQIEEYGDIYRFLYQNLDLWGETEEKQDNALLAIRKGLVNHSIVGDPEINLAATMVELKLIAAGQI
jgi:DNA polymerase III delta prime subunit